MMWALKVNGSTTAAASRGWVKVVPHSEKGAERVVAVVGAQRHERAGTGRSRVGQLHTTATASVGSLQAGTLNRSRFPHLHPAEIRLR